MVDKETFDIAVIGGGPGGYVAAIKAAQAGKKVALIEKGDLGGTCLNVGCIPSKALLWSSGVFRQVREAHLYGITTGDVRFDYAKIQKRKDEVVSTIRRSLEGLLEKNGIAIIRGLGSFLSPRELKVQGTQSRRLLVDKVILATGSQPMDLPAIPCDHDRVRNSTSALALTQLPKSVLIIGGGYIGCEFASLFSGFGVKVTIVEALPSIVMTQGKMVSRVLGEAFQKEGIEIRTNAMVEKVDSTKEGVAVRLHTKEVLKSDLVVVAVGRSLDTTSLDLGHAGLTTGKKGEILVNERMETEVPGIYAIGDVVGKSMLAHVASHEGLVAAENACGFSKSIDYRAVPAVIFTKPEIGTVGLTEEEAREAGYDVSVGMFPFQALGKAIASHHTEGFAQILSDRKTKQILGAQIVGESASNVLAEMVLAINNELTLDCVIETIHAHPTFSEAWLESALLANGTPLHFPPRKIK